MDFFRCALAFAAIVISFCAESGAARVGSESASSLSAALSLWVASRVRLRSTSCRASRPQLLPDKVAAADFFYARKVRSNNCPGNSASLAVRQVSHRAARDPDDRFTPCRVIPRDVQPQPRQQTEIPEDLYCRKSGATTKSHMGVVWFVTALPLGPIALYLVGSCGAGVCIGATGIGGVLIVPLLLLVDIPVSVAAPATIASFLITTSIAVASNIKLRTIPYANAALLCAGAMPGAVVGLMLLPLLPPLAMSVAVAMIACISGVKALRGALGEERGLRRFPRGAPESCTRVVDAVTSGIAHRGALEVCKSELKQGEVCFGTELNAVAVGIGPDLVAVSKGAGMAVDEEKDSLPMLPEDQESILPIPPHLIRSRPIQSPIQSHPITSHPIPF